MPDLINYILVEHAFAKGFCVFLPSLIDLCPVPFLPKDALQSTHIMEMWFLFFTIFVSFFSDISGVTSVLLFW